MRGGARTMGARMCRGLLSTCSQNANQPFFGCSALSSIFAFSSFSFFLSLNINNPRTTFLIPTCLLGQKGAQQLPLGLGGSRQARVEQQRPQCDQAPQSLVVRLAS